METKERIKFLLSDYYFYTNMLLKSSIFSAERIIAKRKLKELVKIDVYKLIIETSNNK